MAKKHTGPMPAQGKYPYPSVYGSHKSMMVRLVEDNPKLCVCLDEHGEYETEVVRLDNGECDPKRYKESRLGKLFSGKAAD